MIMNIFRKLYFCELSSRSTILTKEIIIADFIMPLFEEGGAYCFAHVGQYVGIP